MCRTVLHYVRKLHNIIPYILKHPVPSDYDQIGELRTYGLMIVVWCFYICGCKIRFAGHTECYYYTTNNLTTVDTAKGLITLDTTNGIITLDTAIDLITLDTANNYEKDNPSRVPLNEILSI